MKELLKEEIKFLEDYINYFAEDLDYIMASKLQDRILELTSKLESLN